MILAAHQPNYLPWLGYFSKMENADIFVILDNVQYIRRSYINRTRILGANGDFYLSIPVNFSSGQKISEVTIDKSFNIENHFESIRHAYAGSPNFVL
ncbi:MAG: WbqC family protein, partial [Desulfotomaculaceae bacterium]|nr:WbqC family protein [Desulfotomaculaceae bacterium]